MSDYEVLNKINSPADVKKLNAAERKELAAEMRAAILNRVSKIGGHLGPNLGTVELAIALHTVFDCRTYVNLGQSGCRFGQSPGYAGTEI